MLKKIKNFFIFIISGKYVKYFHNFHHFHKQFLSVLKNIKKTSIENRIIILLALNNQITTLDLIIFSSHIFHCVKDILYSFLILLL